MKFLILILLFGWSYAYVEEGFIVSDGVNPLYAEVHDDMKTELGKKVKDALNHVLQDIKDALQRGKNVSSDLIEEVKKNMDKLKKLGVELEDKTKNLLHDVRERFKSWWKDVLDKLNVRNQTHHSTEHMVHMKTDVGKQIKDALNHTLQDIKDALKRGKNVSHHLLEEVQRNLSKLEKLGIGLENKTKDLLRDVKERVTSWWKNVLDKFNIGNRTRHSTEHFVHADMKTELGKKIKDALNHVLQDIKDALQRGKNISSDLIEEVQKNLDKLKKLGVGLEDKTKDLLHDVKERFKSWWKDVLDKLNVRNQTHHSEDYVELDDEDSESFRDFIRRFQ